MILTSLEYRPNSTIPPKMRRRTPSQMKPNAAQPVGFSPLTCGANHWFVAAEREMVYFIQVQSLSQVIIRARMGLYSVKKLRNFLQHTHVIFSVKSFSLALYRTFYISIFRLWKTSAYLSSSPALKLAAIFCFSAGGAHPPVLSTWSSSMMASLPPPNMMISSLMATARWPCRGLGAGPVVL